MEEPCSRSQALKVIRAIIKDGALAFTKHSEERMLERKIDMQDVLNVLKKGRIFDEPEPHPKTNRWVYRVEGVALDGGKVKVAVDIYEPENKIVLLTVMS